MVVALWRRRNRRGTAMHIQPLWCGATGILRYRIARCDLLRHGLLLPALGQRWHRRTGGAGCDRRLALLVTTAETDIGEALQQRQAADG